MTNKIWISVGEYSGELLAAELVRALRSADPEIQFAGIGGKALRALGVDVRADYEILSVMGVWDVLARLPALRLYEQNVLAHLDRVQPDVAILVDAPGFHFRMAEQIRARGIRVIQYVAPKLWAWGAKRIGRLRRDFDLVLGILPFESDFFTRQGVKYRYIGTPILDRVLSLKIEREHMGFANSDRIVALLPGSRQSEWQHIMPIMHDIRSKMAQRMPGTRFVLPVAASIMQDLHQFFPEKVVEELKEKLVVHWDGLELVRGMSLEVMKIADVAIVASGTATLECALVGTPMVVVYRLPEATYNIVKSAVKIPYVSLVNLTALDMIVPEFIQNFDIDDVVQNVCDLFAAAGETQKAAFRNIAAQLTTGAAQNAAQIILTEF